MQDESPQGGRSKKVHRSLENFDEYNITPPLLTSPRSLEACRRQGIEAEELVFRFFSFTPGESEQDSRLAPLPAHLFLPHYRYEDSFAEHGITQDIQEIRWRHYEKKRREKLSLVREDRQVQQMTFYPHLLL